MEEKSKNRTTSISVSHETGAALTELCNEINCPKNEFVSAAVKYFAKHKLDPRTADRPTVREIDKLEKRMDQFFAFIKKQEKEIIVPMAIKYDTLHEKIDRIFIQSFRKK